MHTWETIRTSHQQRGNMRNARQEPTMMHPFARQRGTWKTRRTEQSNSVATEIFRLQNGLTPSAALSFCITLRLGGTATVSGLFIPESLERPSNNQPLRFLLRAWDGNVLKFFEVNVDASDTMTITIYENPPDLRRPAFVQALA